MKKTNHTIGEKINNLELLEEMPLYRFKNGDSKRMFKFKCFCGNEFISMLSSVKSGNTKSCGCHNIKMIKQRMTKHLLSNHPLFKVWANIIRRVEVCKDKSYINYGGRGIYMCDKWRNDFKDFYDWCINNGYKKGLTIDRINNDGNYEPSNCRFTNRHIQVINRRVINKNNKSGYKGVTISGSKFLSKICVNYKQIHLGTFADKKEAAIAYNRYIIDNNLDHIPNKIE